MLQFSLTFMKTQFEDSWSFSVWSISLMHYTQILTRYKRKTLCRYVSFFLCHMTVLLTFRRYQDPGELCGPST